MFLYVVQADIVTHARLLLVSGFVCVSDHIYCSQVCKPYLQRLSSDCTHTQSYNSKRSRLV